VVIIDSPLKIVRVVALTLGLLKNNEDENEGKGQTFSSNLAPQRGLRFIG
jgi:hypothetical protein